MAKHKEYLLFYIIYIIMAIGIIIYYGITSGFSFSGSIIEEFWDMIILNVVSIMVYFWHIFIVKIYIKHGKRKAIGIKINYISKTKLLLILEKLFMVLAIFFIIIVFIWAFILNEIGILLFVIIPGSLFASSRQGIVWLDDELKDQQT